MVMDFEALMLKKRKQALPLTEPINNPVRPLDPAAGADVPAMEVDHVDHVDHVDVDRGITPPSPDKQKTKENTWSQGTTSLHETQSKMLSVRLHR